MFHSTWCCNWLLAWGLYRSKLIILKPVLNLSLTILSGLAPQDVKLLLEDLGELKPTIFCAVPRVLDRVYSGKMFERSYVQVLSNFPLY